jgi:hypothetical protein
MGGGRETRLSEFPSAYFLKTYFFFADFFFAFFFEAIQYHLHSSFIWWASRSEKNFATEPALNAARLASRFNCNPKNEKYAISMLLLNYSSRRNARKSFCPIFF